MLREELPLPLRWEPEHVGRRLVKAFMTLDRLPRDRGPREPGGHWPKHAVEWVDQLARAELSDEERRIARSGAELHCHAAEFDRDRADGRGLRLAARIARRRFRHGACHKSLGVGRRGIESVRRLCTEKQWAPYTFYRKRAKALAYLADLLNERHVPVF